MIIHLTFRVIRTAMFKSGVLPSVFLQFSCTMVRDLRSSLYETICEFWNLGGSTSKHLHLQQSQSDYIHTFVGPQNSSNQIDLEIS